VAGTGGGDGCVGWPEESSSALFTIDAHCVMKAVDTDSASFISPMNVYAATVTVDLRVVATLRAVAMTLTG